MQLDNEEEKLLRSVALQNARAILLARERAEKELVQTKEALETKTEELSVQREWFEVALSSIGDAVITTDTQGNLTFLNPVAEKMTGWKVADAVGQSLDKVFNIINENTRQQIDNPIAKVLREGVVVGLENHTALIAKDGRETAIDDSAAPIRDTTGKISGAVMVFHDVTEKRRTQHALRRGIERLQLAMAAGRLGDWSWDASTGVVTFSSRAYDIFGLPQGAQITREKLRAMMNPEDRERTSPIIENALANHSHYNIEYQITRPSGEQCWIGVQGIGTYAEDGAVTGMIGVIQDITVQKRMELEREQFTSVLERSLNEIYIFDTEQWHFKYVNEGARRNLGYTMDSMRKLTPLDLKPEFTEVGFREMVKPLLSGQKEKLLFHTVHRRRNGTLYPVEVHLQAVTHENQRVFLAVILDITERKQAEEARLRLAAVVESSDDAIISKSLDGMITSWNKGAELMYGYTAEEAIGKPVTILIPPDLLDEEPSIVERLKRGEKIDHYETVRLRKDGVRLDVALTVSPIKDSSGKIVGASKIARDITERKRAERELKRAKDELEQKVQERTASLTETTEQLESFCYTIAHDLRSPMRAQQSFAQMLLEDYGNSLDQTGQEYARRIINSAQRLDKLVEDLLTYSRITRNELKIEEIQLENIVRNVLEHLSDEIKSQNATISIGPLLSVLAYEPTLNLIITNLIANALKFVNPGVPPRIRIWSELRGNFVRLWVEDKGIGIYPENMGKIFGVFQRLHPMDKYPGTGIGLAIVQKGIERIGGQTGVDSTPGEGSRFWIELPKAK